jgi:hypothetical protein
MQLSVDNFEICQTLNLTILKFYKIKSFSFMKCDKIKSLTILKFDKIKKFDNFEI